MVAWHYGLSSHSSQLCVTCRLAEDMLSHQPGQKWTSWKGLASVQGYSAIHSHPRGLNATNNLLSLSLQTVFSPAHGLLIESISSLSVSWQDQNNNWRYYGSVKRFPKQRHPHQYLSLEKTWEECEYICLWAPSPLSTWGDKLQLLWYYCFQPSAQKVVPVQHLIVKLMLAYFDV